MRGLCWRTKTCSYLHNVKPNTENYAKVDIENTMEVDCIDNDIDANDIETKEECGNCKSNNAKNECDKCGKYFCKNCEYKVSGEESESVIEFFKSRNFVNYTCTTAHFSENSK